MMLQKLKQILDTNRSAAGNLFAPLQNSVAVIYWVKEIVPEMLAMVNAYQAFLALKNAPRANTSDERAVHMKARKAAFDEFVKCAMLFAEKLGIDPYKKVGQ